MPKARAMAHLEHASWVAWNFEKFLVDKDGTMIARFKSGVEPEELKSAIEEALRGLKLPYKTH